MTGSVPSSFQRSHGVIWLDNFAMQNNRGKHFVDLQADNSLIAKNLNVFRGTSSLETRCLTLKTYTVTVYLSKWKPYYQIDYLSCFIFQSKNLEYAITLKAYLWDIYRTFINFLYLQNRGHRSCNKRITNVCILSFDSFEALTIDRATSVGTYLEEKSTLLSTRANYWKKTESLPSRRTLSSRLYPKPLRRTSIIVTRQFRAWKTSSDTNVLDDSPKTP